MKLFFDCDMGGGLIIASKQWFDNFSEELAYSLCIILDVDGRTNQIYDYSDKSWNDVWQLEANKWLSLANSGISAPIILREGKYDVTFNPNLDLSNDDLSKNYKLLHFSNLKVEESEIYIAEAEDFLVSSFSDILEYEEEDFEKINIPCGFYELYCISKEDTGSESAFSIFFRQVESSSASTDINELVCF